MLGSEKEGLAFLQAKAKETEMWSLLSTSLLSEAKLELQNVNHRLVEPNLRLISPADDCCTGREHSVHVRAYRQSGISQCVKEY